MSFYIHRENLIKFFMNRLIGVMFLCSCRCTMSEILVAIFLFFCATYNLLYGANFYYIYIYLQAIAFLIVGTGFCGKSS
jgi:hypothetical protein